MKKQANRKAAANPEATWFGYQQVSACEKTNRVKGVFSSVAKNYDLMNDLMSLRIHRLWKKALLHAINPKADERFLDVAGGTGDIALSILKKTGGAATVTVCDLNPDMLAVGRDRATDRGWFKAKIDWVEGNAEDLPFEARLFDVYTIAFGLRNVTHIDRALADAARVLKPGGRFYCLEFAPVEAEPLKQVYDFYSFTILPWLGEAVAKDRASYQYLAESIRQFPAPDKLASRLAAVGFGEVRYTRLTGGIAVLHEAIRL